MEIIRITWKNLKWFESMLTAAVKRQLTEEDNLMLVGAVEDKTACGVMTLQLFGGIAQIQTLFVAPDYRRRGIATGLVAETGTILQANGISLTGTYCVTDDHREVHAFWSSQEHCTLTKQPKPVYSVLLADLAGISFSTVKGSGELLFMELSQTSQKRFLEQRVMRGEWLLAEYARQRELYVDALCRGYQEKNQIRAVVFIQSMGKRDFYLQYLYGEKGYEVRLLTLMETDRQLLLQVAKKCPDSRLYIASACKVFLRALEQHNVPCRLEAEIYEINWEQTAGEEEQLNG